MIILKRGIRAVYVIQKTLSKRNYKNSTFPFIIHIIHKHVFNIMLFLCIIYYTLVAFAYFVFS